MAVESEQPDWNLPEPVFREVDLGRSIPASEHACSVAMPLWEHNVAYEEGDQSVVSKFTAGYPRFFVNPLVTKLKAQIADEHGIPADNCLLAPTKQSAERCAGYVTLRTGQDAEVLRNHRTSLWLVRTNATGSPALREFWQHAGDIVSSRTAAKCLDGSQQCITQTDSKQHIRERVAALQHVEPDDVYLFPSGMSAIYAAWRIARGSGRSMQHGFPYVDTFKILERFSEGKPLLHLGDCTHPGFSLRDVSSVFCEVPGNPLLSVPDLPTLHARTRSRGAALIVDDTLGAMINTDATPFADLIATSLTKFFSGGGDLLAGSLIVVPGQPRYDEFKSALETDNEDMFADEDAEVLATNCADVEQRVQRINQSAAAVVAALRDHPNVQRVYYPDENEAAFAAVRDEHAGAGYGGLMSILLKDAEHAAPRAYNAMAVSKGPNLGTNFTLCCPYTILAHYDELDFAQQCGVSPYLLRVSVGLEDEAWLIERMLAAVS